MVNLPCPDPARTRGASRWHGVLAAAALLTAAAAQAPPGPAPTAGDAATGVAGDAPGERLVRGPCTEAASRDLFTACDADADDRLDVFEASRALDAVRSPGDHDGFAVLDRDRSGYVTWTEFDAALQESLRRGSTFRVRTVRPLVATAARARPRAATPMQHFLQAHDANQDGGLDPAELEAFLRQSRVPPDAAKQLRALDRDQSGRLEEEELAPWFVLLGGAPRPRTLPPGSALPPPWSAADRDHDGAIDADELRRVLVRLDPALGGSAAALLRALDRDRDGRLQPGELPDERGNESADGADAGGAPLPVRAPLR